MIDLGAILVWLRYKKLAKEYKIIEANRKIAESSMLELNALTVTIHGRLMLSKVCKDYENDLPSEIRRMYWILLQEAPIREYAEQN